VQLTDEEIARLRNSGIRLDREGRFWHEGGEVLHHGLRAALWRWLDRNPDGRWVLRLDPQRFVYLDVDDVPYLVSSLRWNGNAAIGQLSDGSEETLALETLHLRDGQGYLTVKQRFPARLSADAFSALGERFVERDGAVWLDLPTPVRLSE
jgi:hypothetical protein